MPDRFDRAELECDLGERAAGRQRARRREAESRDEVAGEVSGARGRPTDDAADSAVRQDEKDPGYIKGYLPGVRENGAQYTHAALWAVLATALQGNGDRAFELYQMINPLTHARTPEEVGAYKVEPYVVAADVYTAEGQLGRGGWTWYTGSASWMYRVGLEGILGFTKRGDRLFIEPQSPDLLAGIHHRIPLRHERLCDRGAQSEGGISGGAMEMTIDGSSVSRRRHSPGGRRRSARGERTAGE